MSIPLPTTTTDAFRACKGIDCHPGLLLDKYVDSFGKDDRKWQERVQQPTIDAVCGVKPMAADNYDAVFKRHESVCSSSPIASITFNARCIAPLALNLSRAGTLENAGACLHPLYGFAYIPGTGLKGLARAYAETIWCPDQPNPASAWLDIEHVFGYAPGSDLIPTDRGRIVKPWTPLNVPKRLDSDIAAIGSITFHDAWPTTFPTLTRDIVNSHHSDYYANKDNKNPPPGDWEDPIPVYFIAVAPGASFRFHLAARRHDTPPGLLDLARTFLVGGLTQLGVGAKNNAGYGQFAELKDDGARIDTPPLPAKSPRATFTCTLELVTPAFLAGAKQDKDDCDLRGSTLRGQLRWWWRTLHAGYLSVEQLRALEAAIWGDTKHGGAVKLDLEPRSALNVIPSPFKNERRNDRGNLQLNFDDQFIDAHGLKRAGRMQTQGLAYLAYGMDEISRGERRRRHCVNAGAQWRFRITAKPVDGISANNLLTQAQYALWLLTSFGGVGSKSRKGFGSLADLNELSAWSIAKCLSEAKALRDSLKLPSTRLPQPSTSSLDEMIALSRKAADGNDFIEVQTPWVDEWFALDQLGAAYIDFAQAEPDTRHGKHCAEKAALGLPRQIHGPRPQPLGHQSSDAWQRPVPLRNPRDTERYASPVHLHVTCGANNKLAIRLVAFPTSDLPDPATGRLVLQQFLVKMSRNLQDRVKVLLGPLTRTTPSNTTVSTVPAKRLQGTPVQVAYLGLDQKGRPTVQEEGKEKSAIGLGKRPDPLPEEGASITVYIKDDAKRPQYQWDAPPPPKPKTASPKNRR